MIAPMFPEGYVPKWPDDYMTAEQRLMGPLEPSQWHTVNDAEFQASECSKALLQGGYVVIIALVILGLCLERAPAAGLGILAPSYVTEKTT